MDRRRWIDVAQRTAAVIGALMVGAMAWPLNQPDWRIGRVGW